MSVRVTTLVWENGPPNLAQRIVLLCMADYANEDGTGVYPSLATIAERCALTRRAVINAVNALETAGYVDREHRRNGGRHRSNLYTIRVSKLTDSEQRSPSVVNDVHHDSEQRSPSVVNDVHHDSEQRSPDPPQYPPYKPSHKPSRETPPAARRGKNGAAGGGGGADALRAEFKKHGYGWDETVQAVAACEWVTPEYIAAHTAAVKRDAVRDSGIKYPLRVALARMLKGAAAELSGGQGNASDDPDAASAWRQVANAVAQYGATDNALDAISGWGGGDGEKLAEIAEAFDLRKIAYSQGSRTAEQTRSDFLDHYRRAIISNGVAA